MSTASKTRRETARARKYRYVDRGLILLLLTVFQLFCAVPAVFEGNTFYWQNVLMFAGYILFEWLYVAVMHYGFKKVNFELEFIAFFLCGVGMTLGTSVDKHSQIKQLCAIVLGVVVYDVLLWFLKDVRRVMKVRLPLAALSLAMAFVVLLFLPRRAFRSQAGRAI